MPDSLTEFSGVFSEYLTVTSDRNCVILSPSQDLKLSVFEKN